jgi:hypothetical protein
MAEDKEYLSTNSNMSAESQAESQGITAPGIRPKVGETATNEVALVVEIDEYEHNRGEN